MVTDCEGRGITVMHAFLKKEDRISMEHCLKLSPQQNIFVATSCFVVHKDIAEIGAIETVFPDTLVNLCSVHIHQAVRRFLQKEFLSDSVETVMDIFMSQVYIESEKEFHSYIVSGSARFVPQQ
ncbi:hypothetical protein PoB_001516400 [Plakobranchus ocellatus]|uniref:ZSWIM1/3 RNaseH-like domain-containing protein n=1 Tax=Plakobranchus ocellatus TaxID=259542 RepID=A0AAV3Z3S8_9GAST|nr:hypothetical protein PoB_001516400 [Plakobranchus ocellatus]